MKHMVILCTAAVALLLISGCTQLFPPLPATVTPTPTSSPTAAPEATGTSAPATVITAAIATTPSTLENTVIIQKMTFNPPQITVSAGSLVRWVNKDTVTHSVLFLVSAHLNTFAISPGQAFSARFSTPGTYNYSCSIYPSMQGMVIVTA